MLTVFGKAIRKFRIDKNLRLKDMANDLKVSSSFLSAIEIGTKSVPLNFLDRLQQIYKLDSNEYAELYNAMIRSKNEIRINIKNLNTEEKVFLLTIIEQLTYLTQDQRQKILNVINEKT